MITLNKPEIQINNHLPNVDTGSWLSKQKANPRGDLCFDMLPCV